MKRFMNLMLMDPGPDGRKIALDRAIALARANGARLTVAGPAAEVPDDLAEIVRRRLTLDMVAAAQDEERALLEEWTGTLPPDAPPVSIEVLARDSFVQVLRASSAEATTSSCWRRRGRSVAGSGAPRRIFFGNARCPSGS